MTREKTIRDEREQQMVSRGAEWDVSSHSS